MSQFAAVTWKFKRDFDEGLTQLFKNCARPGPFVIIDDQGSQMRALAMAAVSEARGDR
jgi:hypothetical protein